MNRLRELDDLKAVCLLLLFIVHSDLIHINYELTYRLKGLLLGGFFLAAGYLVYLSLSHKNLKQFITNKGLKLYIPYILAIILYFYMRGRPPFSYWPSDAPIIHALGLNVLNYYIESSNYNPYHLWYIPVLLIYMALFAILHRIQNKWLKLFIASFIFVGISLTWPNGLNDYFEYYYLPFFVGYFMAEWQLMEHLGGWSIPILALVACSMTQAVPNSGWAALNHLFGFMNGGLYRTSIALLVLVILKIIKPPLVGRIAKYSLTAYLLEPIISYLISSRLFGIPFPNDVSGEIYPVFIILRIVSTLLLAWTICFITTKITWKIKNIYTTKPITKNFEINLLPNLIKEAKKS